jgi:hypothetical protein
MMIARRVGRRTIIFQVVISIQKERGAAGAFIPDLGGSPYDQDGGVDPNEASALSATAIEPSPRAFKTTPPKRG